MTWVDVAPNQTMFALHCPTGVLSAKTYRAAAEYILQWRCSEIFNVIDITCHVKDFDNILISSAEDPSIEVARVPRILT